MKCVIDDEQYALDKAQIAKLDKIESVIPNLPALKEEPEYERTRQYDYFEGPPEYRLARGHVQRRAFTLLLAGIR